ncbi:MAG: leucine-rich repeat domain-containing protein, partial [Alphaproteobacteria bacterium]|nr:leucine-rich repeat domain-containing protein [Alphaproteobacteria bacterium]
MTIYGPAQKDENGAYTNSATIPNRAFCSDMSGWSGKTTVPNITAVEIAGNITSIGESAFWKSKIEHIDIPNTVTTIKSNAFCSNHNLDSIIIPASVTSIENNAFDGTSIAVFIEGDSVHFGKGLARTFGQPTLFCRQGITSCEGKAPNVEYYTTTDDGFYQIGDKLYATANLVTSGAACDDATNCQAILEAVKQGKPFEVGGKYYATLDLFAHSAACTNKQNCDDILAAQNVGTSFKVGSRIYNSIEDFAKGNHVKYLIYTVEEANRVAGDRNTVTIRYK